MAETWKDIKNYEGYYQVSDLGRVRSLDRCVWCKNVNHTSYKKGIVLKIQYNKKTNIYYVNLNKNGSRKAIPVHRLVAEAFLPLPSEHQTTVNHIDGNRQNNQVSNLEWNSYSENEYHAYAVLHRAKTTTGAKPRKTKVVDKHKHVITYCSSVASASRLTGLSETQIRRLMEDLCKNPRYDIKEV